MEGLSVLLQNLSLSEFCLDLYEVSGMSEDGYLILADALGSLGSAKKLHLDLSA
jgi:hypothetical protein